jgi:hypothetical protein
MNTHGATDLRYLKIVESVETESGMLVAKD